MVGLARKVFWSVVQFFLQVFEKTVNCLSKLKKALCKKIKFPDMGIVSNKDKPEDLVTWSSWDDMPIIVTDSAPLSDDSIQMKIHEYRERRFGSQMESDPESGIDYFQDMVPKITKQPKILVQGVEAAERMPETSLSLDVDPNFTLPELGVWEEIGRWEDHSDIDWSTFEILRETRKMERVKRVSDHQRKKLGKSPQPFRGTGLGKQP